MREPLPSDSVLSVIVSGLSLAARCGCCPHRTLIRREMLTAFAGNYGIGSLPLVCRCGSKVVTAFVLETPDEVETFIEPNSASDDPGRTGQWHPIF